MAVAVGVNFEAEGGEVDEDTPQVLIPEEPTAWLFHMGSQAVERGVQTRDVQRIAHQDSLPVQ